MKKTLFAWIIILFPALLSGQAVGINESGVAPNPKAMLDISSTQKGVLIPRMTTAQRIAIAPGISEKGLLVYDTNNNRYMTYNGAAWETVGDGLWQSHASGIYHNGRVSINAFPVLPAELFVYVPFDSIGPGKSGISVQRSGTNVNVLAGTSFLPGNVDAGLKSFNFWGNQFSVGIAAYSYLDYNQSAAFIASNQDNTIRTLLSYKDNLGRIWAGHLTGDARISGQLGVGVTPNTVSLLHAETANFDRTGYFFNNRSTAATTYGIYAGAFGTGSGAKQGGSFEAFGGSGVNMAIRALASGGSTNWAGYFAAGNVFINNNLVIKTETVAAGYSLCVNGRIIGEELRIQDMANWPDYVFEDGYTLMPLAELEARILADRHLPEIPPAALIESEGILVGEMQSLLMKKIEELTLYTIAQQKQIDAQQTRIDYLVQQVHRKKNRNSTGKDGGKL